MSDFLSDLLANFVVSRACTRGTVSALRVDRDAPYAKYFISTKVLSAMEAGTIASWHVGGQYYASVLQSNDTWGMVPVSVGEMIFEELGHKDMAEFLGKLDPSVSVDFTNPSASFLSIEDTFRAICDANDLDADRLLNKSQTPELDRLLSRLEKLVRQVESDDENGPGVEYDDFGRVVVDLKPRGARHGDVLRILKNCSEGTSVSWVDGPNSYTVERLGNIYWKLVDLTTDECYLWQYFRTGFVQDLGPDVYQCHGVINNGQLAKIVMLPDVKSVDLALPE